MLTLNAEKRDKTKKNPSLRADGFIPAVYYGRVEKAASIAVSARDFERVFKAAGESSIITLDVAGDDKQALIYGVQRDPVKNHPIHVDFYVIEKDRMLNVNVPISYVGESPAVEDLDGILVKVLHEIEIEALPKNLPHDISVDISVITDFDTQILVRDLKLPEGVTAVTDGEEVVALAEEAHEEEPETPSEAPDLESIEVEQKGKEEESGGEGDESAEKSE